MLKHTHGWQLYFSFGNIWWGVFSIRRNPLNHYISHFQLVAAANNSQAMQPVKTEIKLEDGCQGNGQPQTLSEVLSAPCTTGNTQSAALPVQTTSMVSSTTTTTVVTTTASTTDSHGKHEGGKAEVKMEIKTENVKQEPVSIGKQVGKILQFHRTYLPFESSSLSW